MKNRKEPKTSASQMHLLLVGDNEQDFHYLRGLLARASDGQIRLDHAPSLEQALARISQTTYDLLMCDYKPGTGLALTLLSEVQKAGSGVPVIFLSDRVDQSALATAIKAGAYDCVQVSSLDEASITRAIRYAVEMYCKDRQQQKAEVMLNKLWRAVEQSADIVLITDRAGVIEYVNPAFELVTGFTKQEAIGRTPRILKSSHHPLRFYRDVWETILDGSVYRGVMVNRRKSGDTFFAEKTITPLRDVTGKITHFISNDRDITDRRRLEAQLQQAQKMDAIGRLAGGVAHDFNNLLMVISAYAELLLESLAANNPQRRRVQEILTASRRAADLTRQLLAFGRKQVQSLQLLDLNRVLSEISKMLHRLIGEDIHLEIVPARSLGKVRADPVQMEQIIMNLAANARDAMPNGGKLIIETLNVRLDQPYVQKHTMVPPGDYVLLAFSDTGQGIAAEHLAHIFEPFYTTKEEGHGTGLGLATVYGIVKQSNGFIWVYSEPGLGTAFKVYLPRAQKEAEKILPTPALVDEFPRGSETVLLVEDEPAVRQSAHEFLTMSGYTILEASHGEEALAVARSHSGPIDLLITDVIMPHTGGSKLAEQLLAERPGLKVLFVSGYAENTVLRQGAIDLNNNFLQKPFSLRSLAHKIRQVLDRRPALAAAAAASSPR